MVRKGILGESERKVLEAYVKGERLKSYTTVITRLRQFGLGAIIQACEADLRLLRRFARIESKHQDSITSKA